MNLDNLNLVELNAQEVQEVEGGKWWVEVLVSSAIDNWGDIKKGFSDGWNMK